MFTAFPQFVYNLRKSAFLKFFNCSPDETAFYQSCLLREQTKNMLLMIQPSLTEYGFEHPQLSDGI